MLNNVMVYSEKDLLDYASVRKWLGNLADSTKKVNLFTFKYFMNWVRLNGEKFSEFTPDDLIEYQQEASTTKEQYEILDELLIKYVQSQKEKYSTGYITRNYATLRGFFKRNRAVLPQDPDVNTRGEKEPVHAELTIEEAKDIIQNSTPVYKAVYLSMLQGALDSTGFVYWNTHGYASLLEQLRDDPDVIKIDLPGRKKMRNVQPFHTYIGGDAIELVRRYLKIRPDSDKEAIFLNDYGNPINGANIQQYWLRLLRRRGFIDEAEDPSNPGNRYGKNLHELRDIFRTQFRKAPESPDQTVPEFCMGHTVDPLRYDKATKDEEWTRGEYMKGLPMLQIMSSGEPFGRVEKQEIKNIEVRLQARIREQDNRIAELEQEKANDQVKAFEMLKQVKQRLDKLEKEK